jgi:hypothetical protein
LISEQLLKVAIFKEKQFRNNYHLSPLESDEFSALKPTVINCLASSLFKRMPVVVLIANLGISGGFRRATIEAKSGPYI